MKMKTNELCNRGYAINTGIAVVCILAVALLLTPGRAVGEDRSSSSGRTLAPLPAARPEAPPEATLVPIPPGNTHFWGEIMYVSISSEGGVYSCDALLRRFIGMTDTELVVLHTTDPQMQSIFETATPNWMLIQVWVTKMETPGEYRRVYPMYEVTRARIYDITKQSDNL